MTNPDPARLLEASRYVLIDFDGPICNIFAGLPANEVANRLRQLLADGGVRLLAETLNETDPLAIYRTYASHSRPIAERLDRALREAELAAVATARPTPHAAEFLEACRRFDRAVAVVSNNSRAAVESYLSAHHLHHLVHTVAGRDAVDPTLMKPNPHLVLRALRELHADPTTSVMIGDSTADIEAARAVGVPTIMYANKPNKRERFTAAGAHVIIDDLVTLIVPLTTPTSQAARERHPAE